MYNLRQNLPAYNIYGFKSDFYQMEQITHTLRLQRSALQRGFVAFMLLQSRTHNTFLFVVVVIWRKENTSYFPVKVDKTPI